MHLGLVMNDNKKWDHNVVNECKTVKTNGNTLYQ